MNKYTNKEVLKMETEAKKNKKKLPKISLKKSLKVNPKLFFKDKVKPK